MRARADPWSWLTRMTVRPAASAASAHHVAESIAALPDDRTVVLVTHGQSWIGGAGRAVRLDGGKLLEPPAGVAGPAGPPAAVTR